MGMELGSVIPTWRNVRGEANAEVSKRDALRSFDAYFLGEMLKRATAQSGAGPGDLDGGSAGRMYRDYLNEELARIVAESGRFGMAQALEGELGEASAPVGGEAGHE